MKNNFLLQIIASSLLLIGAISAEETRLLRMPDISDTHIAFVYAKDIWIADVDGSNARRLTTFSGEETNPRFSPDGKLVAFTGEYDGNTDVYVVSVDGGEPKRMTWHPSVDLVRGWSHDGKKIIFASNRESAPIGFILKFWSIQLDQKMPEPLPIPRIADGRLSPDDQKMCFQKIYPWESEWRNYRGGQTNPIRIIDLSTLEEEKLPWDGSNDINPVWIDDMIYFRSDRDYAMNIWSYNTKTKALNQVTHFKEFDCKSLESGAGKLIFENGGYLYVLDPANNQPKKLSIEVKGDFPWARPHWEKVGSRINTYNLSPTGKRAVFEARGEITISLEESKVTSVS